MVMSRDPLKIFSHPKIPLEQLKLETSHFVHWLSGWPCEVLAFRLTNSPSSGRSHGYVTSLNFGK